MLIWSYLAASPVKIEAKVWMKNWLGNWSWGVRIKTWLVFIMKNSIVVCKFLSSLLTLSHSLADPGRRHDLQLYPPSLTQYIKIREKNSWWILFSIAAACYSARLSYDFVYHHPIDLRKQCFCSKRYNLLILRFISTVKTVVRLEESWCF